MVGWDILSLDDDALARESLVVLKYLYIQVMDAMCRKQILNRQLLLIEIIQLVTKDLTEHATRITS